MSQKFDPYYEWLAIPPKYQPPDHYRLLGIELFEDNPNVIERAADRQMSHVRTFQAGRNSKLSQKLLNELSAAKICLLSVEKKREYDEQLRAAPGSPEKEANRAAEVVEFLPPSQARSIATHPSARRRRSMPLYAHPALLAVVLIVSVALLISLVAYVLVPHEPPVTNRDLSHAYPLVRELENPATVPEIVDPPEEVTPVVTPAAEEMVEAPKEEAGDPTEPPSAPKSPVSPTSTDPSQPVEKPPEPTSPKPQESTPQPKPPASDPPPEQPTATEPAAQIEQRQPIPSEAARVEAERRVKEVFQNEVEAAKEPADKIALAADLLRRSHEEEDPALKYVMLVEACTLATDAASPPFALRAIRKLEAGFQVDRWALSAATISKLSNAARTNRDRRVIADFALSLTDEAVGEGEVDAAEKALNTLTMISRRLKDRLLTRATNRRVRDLEGYKRLWDQAQSAREQLVTSPNDGEAHLMLGKFLCFVRNDWQDGLSHLAGCSDGELKELAGSETKNPTDADDQAALAQAWLAWADAAKDVEQSAAWSRAQVWLKRAIPQLSGLELTKATKQLEELSGKVDSPSGRTALPNWIDAPVGEIAPLAGHSKEIRSLDISQSGRWAVTASIDGNLRIWNLARRETTAQLQLGANLTALALSPDEQLVTAVIKDTLSFWNLAASKKVGERKSDASIRDLAVSADGRLLWAKATSNTKNVVFWEPNTNVGAEWNCPNVPYCLAISRSGRYAAIANDRRAIMFVNVETSQIASLAGHKQAIQDIAFSPNERLMASCDPTTVILWDLSTGKEIRRLQATTSSMRVAFSPDSGRLVSSGNVSSLTVWDVRSGVTLKVITSPEGAAGFTTALAVLPDALAAVSGGTDGILRLWRLPD